MRNKILSILIIIALSLTNIPVVTASANNSNNNYGDSSGHPLNVEVDGNSFKATNPAYEGADPIEASTPTLFTSFLTPVINDTVYTDVDALIIALREMCVMREGTVELTCYCASTDIPDTLNNYVLSHLYDETSSPKQGDYLYWNSSGLEGNGIVRKTESGDWLYTISLNLTYRSTAAQEAMIDEEIADLLSSTGAIGSRDLKDNYSKALAIYDYEIDYYEYVIGDTNHSTFSAIINNQTVCQGYATAFYRLSRTLGMNSRVIASTTHGWNIVKIDDYYYLVDATWGDNPGYEEVFFLKGSDNFPSTGDHTAKDAYTNASFRATYPISSADYVYNPTTEETTETTEETTETTEATTETTEITTEESETTEDITTEDIVEGDEITEESTEEEITEDVTTESSLNDSSVLYESDNIVIIREDYEDTTELPYDNDETASTESWEEEEHKDPTYTVDTEVQVQTTSGNNSTVVPHSTENTSSSATEEAKEVVQLTINGVDCTESMMYESEEGITKLEITGYEDCSINFYNETGLKEVDNTVNSNTAIKAIQINTDKKLYYAIKTKQLGWLDFTSGEMSGVLNMDDYVTGIKFADKLESEEEYTTIIVGDCREYADYTKTPLYYTLHTDEDWDGMLSNGAINANGTKFNGIRIGCNTEIKYKVQQDGKWLKEVSNWVLAGNPFSESAITGFSITGEDIIFRVQFGDGTWSDWYESGQSIANDKDFISDIQIYQK